MNFIKIMNNAERAINRTLQKADEAIFDADKTEYDDDYLDHIRKVNVLIHITKVLILQTKWILESNFGNRELKDFGMSFERASDSVKHQNNDLFTDFDLHGKCQMQMRLALEDFKSMVTINYLKNIQNILNDLQKFKDEETALEVLRLDYDSLRDRVKKAITDSGKDLLEKELEHVKFEFELKRDYNYEFFKGIDQIFVVHRELFGLFIRLQLEYHSKCSRYLDCLKSTLESGRHSDSPNDLSQAIMLVPLGSEQEKQNEANDNWLVIDNANMEVPPPATDYANMAVVSSRKENSSVETGMDQSYGLISHTECDPELENQSDKEISFNLDSTDVGKSEEEKNEKISVKLEETAPDDYTAEREEEISCAPNDTVNSTDTLSVKMILNKEMKKNDSNKWILIEADVIIDEEEISFNTMGESITASFIVGNDNINLEVSDAKSSDSTLQNLPLEEEENKNVEDILPESTVEEEVMRDTEAFNKAEVEIVDEDLSKIALEATLIGTNINIEENNKLGREHGGVAFLDSLEVDGQISLNLLTEVDEESRDNDTLVPVCVGSRNGILNDETEINCNIIVGGIIPDQINEGLENNNITKETLIGSEVILVSEKGDNEITEDLEGIRVTEDNDNVNVGIEVEVNTGGEDFLLSENGVEEVKLNVNEENIPTSLIIENDKINVEYSLLEEGENKMMEEILPELTVEEEAVNDTDTFTKTVEINDEIRDNGDSSSDGIEVESQVPRNILAEGVENLIGNITLTAPVCIEVGNETSNEETHIDCNQTGADISQDQINEDLEVNNIIKETVIENKDDIPVSEKDGTEIIEGTVEDERQASEDLKVNTVTEGIENEGAVMKANEYSHIEGGDKINIEDSDISGVRSEESDDLNKERSQEPIDVLLLANTEDDCKVEEDKGTEGHEMGNERKYDPLSVSNENKIEDSYRDDGSDSIKKDASMFQ